MPNLHLFASVGNNAGSVASMAETGPRRPGSTISDARPLDTWQLRRRETGAPPQRAKNLSLKTRSPLTSIHARATATDATDVSAAWRRFSQSASKAWSVQISFETIAAAADCEIKCRVSGVRCFEMHPLWFIRKSWSFRPKKQWLQCVVPFKKILLYS